MKTAPQKPIFISRRGLATRWDKHISTIRRIEKSGEITPHVLPGSRDVVYRIEEIEKIETESKIES